jgi:hypothetical protein
VQHAGGCPDLENAAVQALDTALRVEPWLAEGCSIEKGARRLAAERGLNADRIIEIYREIKAALSASAGLRRAGDQSLALGAPGLKTAKTTPRTVVLTHRRSGIENIHPKSR